MKRLSVLMLIAGLFLTGSAVQAIKNPFSKAKSACKKTSMKDMAAKYKKYAENYKKMAAKMKAKGDTKKAAYYTKLADAKSKIAKAYETNDLKALKKAQAEYSNLKKGKSSCRKTSKDMAAKYKKYAENYKKMAAKMKSKGDTKKAAYYTKLADAKLKIAKAYETNDMKAVKKAQTEYYNLKKGKSVKKGCATCKSCKK